MNSELLADEINSVTESHRIDISREWRAIQASKPPLNLITTLTPETLSPLDRFPPTPTELAHHFALMSGTFRVHPPPIANDLELVALMDPMTQAVYAAYVRGER